MQVTKRGCAMTDRLEIDRLLRELYAARARSDLNGVCRLFSSDADFQIAGASRGSPLAITASGIVEIRSWLALMIRVFQLNDHSILTVLIDDAQAAVHWRATVHSRVTGTTVPTELIDLVEIKQGCISSYVEFFVPR
jgi:ketosteroid isomerase-like protein